MTQRKVLITGANGLVGGLTIKHLGDKYQFSGLARRNVTGIPHLSADITDAEIPATWPMVDLDWPERPDSPYAVGKLVSVHGFCRGAVVEECRAIVLNC